MPVSPHIFSCDPPKKQPLCVSAHVPCIASMAIIWAHASGFVLIAPRWHPGRLRKATLLRFLSVSQSSFRMSLSGHNFYSFYIAWVVHWSRSWASRQPLATLRTTFKKKKKKQCFLKGSFSNSCWHLSVEGTSSACLAGPARPLQQANWRMSNCGNQREERWQMWSHWEEGQMKKRWRSPAATSHFGRELE